MKIGLIGLSNSGKTTIFNALTKSMAEVTSYSMQKAEPNLAVVEVEDSRVTDLSKMYEPKKTVFATIDFIDFVGMTSGAAKDGTMDSGAFGLVKTADALALVLRNFNDPVIDESLGLPDPKKDAEGINDELLLSDLIIVEKRIKKIAADILRGKKTPQLVAEDKVLQKIAKALGEEIPVRDLDFSNEERRIITGFQFLSAKPLMLILNSGEDNYGANSEIIGNLSAKFGVIEFAGNFEMELSRLEDQEEAALFMEDLGISESARARLTTFAYDLLGYISFFTVGKDEVRAWTIHRGETALEAAGTIHSDLARGFIRAECFTYDQLMECGSEKGIREKGHFRLEGKQYIAQDGDILHIRFSI
jgi:ribosome-binding ATPase